MNMGVGVDCSCLRSKITVHAHTHFLTHSASSLPTLLSLALSLPLSVGYIPPPFSLAHCCSQHSHHNTHPHTPTLLLTHSPFLLLFLCVPFSLSPSHTLSVSTTALPSPLPTLCLHALSRTHRVKLIVLLHFLLHMFSDISVKPIIK